MKRIKERRQKIGKKASEKKVNDNRYVYIDKLPPLSKIEDIYNHFKTIGKINIDEIFMFANNDGTPRGDCIISYIESKTAPYAKLHFDGKPFLEHMIKVNLASQEQIIKIKKDLLVDHKKREREEINALEAEIFRYRGIKKRSRYRGKLKLFENFSNKDLKIKNLDMTDVTKKQTRFNKRSKNYDKRRRRRRSNS